jgi:phosphoglycolate phosphatase-like HAD superfamily hydrolase
MAARMPDILALDFDGVILDGLIEYFQTAWQAYCRIWSPENKTAPDGLAEQFYRLRPVVETGWEMPLVLRSLLIGIPEDEILYNWNTIAQARIVAEMLDPVKLAATVDRVRDEWIIADREDWLAQHRFYPGVLERLQQTIASPVYPVIITTKEGRFVRQLLEQQGVHLEEAQIWGKERKQPKAQTLRDLRQSQSPEIWFVEDRLKTLQNIKSQPDLAEIRLYLADWGYNTERDCATAEADDRIHLISLQTFAQDLTRWT